MGTDDVTSELSLGSALDVKRSALAKPLFLSSLRLCTETKNEFSGPRMPNHKLVFLPEVNGPSALLLGLQLEVEGKKRTFVGGKQNCTLL